MSGHKPRIDRDQTLIGSRIRCAVCKEHVWYNPDGVLKHADIRDILMYEIAVRNRINASNALDDARQSEHEALMNITREKP